MTTVWGTTRAFAAIPPNFSERQRVEYCDWLLKHQLDASEASVPGFVEVYEADGQWWVRYLSYELDEQGNRFVDPDSHGTRAKQYVRTQRVPVEPASLPGLAQD